MVTRKSENSQNSFCPNRLWIGTHYLAYAYGWLGSAKVFRQCLQIGLLRVPVNEGPKCLNASPRHC